ncbi:MAG: GHKL domain-containing protein [Clostridia bacterium]|nr:GHKL domain-containing protein [Clostridia bacterium]
MEILHNLWNVLCTEDENLTRYVALTLTFVEIYVSFKLSTTILSINYTKKQRNIYIMVLGILIILSELFIPSQISIFIHLILTPVIIKLIFKTSTTKAILADILPMLISVIIESIYAKICFIILGKTPIEYQNIIIYRIPIMMIVYFTLFLISISIKLAKENFIIFEYIDVHRKKLIILNLIFILILIGIQFYLFIFYNTVLPMYITLISLLSLIAYSFISLYSIIKSVNLEITKRDLEQSELHNKTLGLLYNNVSAFKHDFSNIITALGGYINSKNMEGLEKYYDNILDECNINNNLSTLNPNIINNPAIYNILAAKYYKADELGITINLQVFINLNELKMDVYDFCRILGILLDNAIEASSKCEEKIINIDIRDIRPKKCQSITIENTFLDKNIDISRLAEKGYTSKTKDKESHGIGLWQVAKLIKKNKNTILDTSKDDKYFRQELVIYYI